MRFYLLPIIAKITDLLIWIIGSINRSKSNCLSQKLFNLAELYNTKPGKDNYNKSTQL